MKTNYKVIIAGLLIIILSVLIYYFQYSLPEKNGLPRLIGTMCIKDASETCISTSRNSCKMKYLPAICLDGYLDPILKKLNLYDLVTGQKNKKLTL